MLNTISERICLVGCGKMGQAMLSAWLESEIPPSHITVIEPEAAMAADISELFGGITVIDNPDDIEHIPELIVFAVKPQTLAEILPYYLHFVSPSTFFISIAAGKTIDFFHKYLGKEAAIIRAMPNLPAVVMRGMTALCANTHVNANQRKAATELFATFGQIEWLDESLMDAVTALSGSGPAYVFLLAEVMSEIGISLGLPAEIAEKMTNYTIYGSSELLHTEKASAAELRKRVTSKGGTTAAALDVLMDETGGIKNIFQKAIHAAWQRSRELAE